MIKDEVQKHTARYNVEIKERPSSIDATIDTTFVDIKDANQELPALMIQFVKGSIYSVHFLNNEFFEIPEPELWAVVGSLLQGSYKIESSFFKKKSIKIISEGKEIIPERINSDRNYKNDYSALPKHFSEK